MLGGTEVAEGVFKLGTRWVNYYLVAEGDEFILIDAGYPRYWEQLTSVLTALGSSPKAVRATSRASKARSSLIRRRGSTAKLGVRA